NQVDYRTVIPGNFSQEVVINKLDQRQPVNGRRFNRNWNFCNKPVHVCRKRLMESKNKLNEQRRVRFDLNRNLQYVQNNYRQTYNHRPLSTIKKAKEPNKRLNASKNKLYNLPTAQEVAALITNEDNKVVTSDLVVHHKDGNIQRVDEKYGFSDPLHYVLMLPREESENLDNSNLDKNSELAEKTKFVTAMQYYAYQIHDRENSSLNLFGRLFHQYIVEQYAGKVEAGRLNYLFFNQKSIRAELYQGMLDSLNSDTPTNPENVGKKIILSSSFSGSPRRMHQLYQDAMSVVRAFGKPDLIITMTCNPKWPEIQKEILESQTPNERPDIFVRIFRIKLKILIEDLTKNHILGRVIAHIYVIEFQKRGLPHAHILIILHPADKIKTIEQVNQIVSAEIPDKEKHPNLYRIVKFCMIHGSCGPDFPNAPCMFNGVCSKCFPKDFSEETVLSNNTYPIYKRSSKNPENQWTVSFCPYLSIKFDCHINVEVCNAVTAVKYLYRGHDKSLVSINSENENEKQSSTEIDQYLDMRYVSACESIWRMFHFSLNSQNPKTIRLPVHLKNKRICYYDSNKKIEEIIEANSDSELTAFFELNKTNYKARDFLYYQMPNSKKIDTIVQVLDFDEAYLINFEDYHHPNSTLANDESEFDIELLKNEFETNSNLFNDDHFRFLMQLSATS
ncbi:unnamed protein product, partial [Brachionus calyciflorus]